MNIKKFLNKKIVAIAALTLAVVTAGVGSTIAYLKDSTQTLTNTFSVGSIETKLVEVAAGTTKEPYVLNVGKNDCYVRVRATVSPSAELSSVVNGLDTTNWVLKNGYYYYKNTVAPNTMTATPLFTSIKSEGLEVGDSFDIVIYQEAVQSKVSTPDGVITDMDKIWAFYDAYGKEATDAAANEVTNNNQ